MDTISLFWRRIEIWDVILVIKKLKQKIREKNFKDQQKPLEGQQKPLENIF